MTHGGNDETPLQALNLIWKENCRGNVSR